MQINGAHENVITGRMMFCEVIGKVLGAFAPIDLELFLLDSVLNPVETHINGFGAALFDGFVGDTGSGGVVDNNAGGWLGMSQFFEG